MTFCTDLRSLLLALVAAALLCAACTERTPPPPQHPPPGQPPPGQPPPSLPPPGQPPLARRPPPPGGPGVCGRMPHEPIQQLTWGHGEPNAPETIRCDHAETVWGNVPHDDRVCRQDSDCTILKGMCFVRGLNKQAASKPEYQTRTCVDPAAGACPGSEEQPKCHHGCCAP